MQSRQSMVRVLLTSVHDSDNHNANIVCQRTLCQSLGLREIQEGAVMKSCLPWIQDFDALYLYYLLEVIEVISMEL